MNRRLLILNSLLLGSCSGLLNSCSSPKKPAAVKEKPRIEDLVLPLSEFQKLELVEQLSYLGFTLGTKSFIRIFKNEKILEIWLLKADEKFHLYRKFPICTFSGKLGAKLKEGDYQAPEGIYSVAENQLNPNSQYHLAMKINYPNDYDRFRKRTGSNIMIHGDCVSSGCYAMDDKQIEIIYSIVSASLQRGQLAVPVHIFPFRLTKTNLELHKNHEWIGFWQELSPIYNYFEEHKKPPFVKVENGFYKIYEI